MTARQMVLFILLLFGLNGSAQKWEQKELLATFRQQILESEEVKEWQHAVIAYQRNNILLCELKKKQSFLVTVCGKNAGGLGKGQVLELFRRMRLEKELKVYMDRKSDRLRTNFPHLVLYGDDTFFTQAYAPIKAAREVLLQQILKNQLIR